MRVQFYYKKKLVCNIVQDAADAVCFVHSVVNCLNWILLGLAFLSIEPLTFIGLFTSKSRLEIKIDFLHYFTHIDLKIVSRYR